LRHIISVSQNLKIGDLVYCLPFDKIYRNDGYFPYDGEKFVPLDSEDYMYGKLPEKIWPFFGIKSDSQCNPSELNPIYWSDEDEDEDEEDGDVDYDDDRDERSWGMWGPWSETYLKTLSEGKLVKKNNRRTYETSYGFAMGMIEKTQ